MSTRRQIRGTITFGQFDGTGPVTFAIDDNASRFHYLRVNPATRRGGDELPHRISDRSRPPLRVRRDQVHAARRDARVRQGSPKSSRTTRRSTAASTELPSGAETGTGLLKFRTFEDWAALGNLAGFLASFQVTGTDDPVTQLQARMRFLGFTAQFVMREYDPLSPGSSQPAPATPAQSVQGAGGGGQ